MLRLLKPQEFETYIDLAYELALDPARSGRLRSVYSA